MPLAGVAPSLIVNGQTSAVMPATNSAGQSSATFQVAATGIYNIYAQAGFIQSNTITITGITGGGGSGSGTLANYVSLGINSFSCQACLNSLPPSNILMIVVIINTPWGFQGRTGVGGVNVQIGQCVIVGGGWPTLPNGTYTGQLILVAVPNQLAFYPPDPSTYAQISDPLNIPPWTVSGTYTFQPLSATISANPTIDPLGIPVSFYANTSGGVTAGRSWVWDFGDGSAKNIGQAAQHLYNNIGTYLVTVTVTDAIGEQVVATPTVTVVSSDPGGV